MLRALKIRLYPNKEQTTEFNKLLGCYRFVFNYMLRLKTNTYAEAKENLSMCDLSKHFHGVLLKDENFSWLREQNTKVMKQSIRQVFSAFDNFFNNHKGYPKFKSKKEIQTALFPLEAISAKNAFKTRRITLTKAFKNIPFRCSKLYWNRLKTYKDKIRSATLTRTKSGKYELSILIDFPDNEFVRFARTGRTVGVDLGAKDFVITSDGNVFKNKHFFKKTENKILKQQRRLSRKQCGSCNREKERLKLAKLFEHLSNQKNDYLHTIINFLLSNYDVVCIEDLNTSGMLKNHKLAKAIQEVGFYKFKQVLEYKALMEGKRVAKVGRWFPSSKLCHVCGYKYKDLRLNERQWTCPDCGTHHDRDVNAAINIKNEGLRIIGSRTPEFKPVESPTMDDRLQDLRSGDPLKQEVEIRKFL